MPRMSRNKKMYIFHIFRYHRSNEYGLSPGSCNGEQIPQKNQLLDAVLALHMPDWHVSLL